MRACIGVGIGLAVAFVVAGCRPSATVRGTTPVANLQSYRGLLVRGTRVDARGRGWGRLTFMLERAAVARISGRCAFRDVRVSRRSAAGPDDLILDLTVQQAFRGSRGSGLIQNENLVTVDVKLVLSDGWDQELLGAAAIRGKSAGLVLTTQSPEQEAINAVADSIAQMLVNSGCAAPRIARARPAYRRREPAAEAADVEMVSSERSDTIARAEAENEEGKRLFRAADVPAARTHFLAAIRLHRDPRYVFNLCLAEESLGSFAEAVSTCQSVLAMKPDDALAEKVKLRLRILADKQKQ